MSELHRVDEVSLFAIGAAVIKRRRLAFSCMAVGGIVGVAAASLKPPEYAASASFVVQSSDAPRSGLATIAGQFGVSLPAGNQSASPDFYAALVKSRVLLLQVAHDTFSVSELNRRGTLFDLLDIRSGSVAFRDEAALRRLQAMISAPVTKATGVVQLNVISRWPSVSTRIAQDLLNLVDDFNQRTKQSQATAERRFVQGRLAIADTGLRNAENRLKDFLAANRQFNSADLAFERDRLQRDVTLKQQIFMTLTQALEDARLREVRDIPAITVIDNPWTPPNPVPRGRLTSLILGLLAGGMAGVVLALTLETLRRRRLAQDPESREFFQALDQVRIPAFRRIPTGRSRAR